MAVNKVRCQFCGMMYWDNMRHVCPPAPLIPGRRNTAWYWVGGILGLMILGLFLPSPKEAVENPKTQVQEVATPVDPIRGPLPTASFWDNLTIEVKEYLQANLKDPDSLKLIEASEIFKGEDSWVQQVRYRAKNSFGGYVISQQTFYIRHGAVVKVEDD